MVVLETKALKDLRKKISHSKELNHFEKENFGKFIGYLTKDEKNMLSLLI